MITQKFPWQQALIQAVTDINVLAELLNIELDNQFTTPFPLRVPRGFVNKMKKGDLNDPLLLQVLALKQETLIDPNFSTDPLQESNCNPHPGILHKFKNRVLLTLTGHCAVNCRYCFRRHFPYENNTLSLKTWEKNLGYVRQNPDIIEVILSGGDPLTTNDNYLKALIDHIESIDHIQYLRIHSRVPIVLPERINENFINILQNRRLKITMIVHCNHAQELCSDIAHSVQLLKNNNITVFNQSVLLKNVNDNISTLKELSFALYHHGIIPYYINLLDKVQGAQHFQVDNQTISDLIEKLSCELPGFLLPRFVREVPGAAHKIVQRPHQTHYD